MYLMSHHFVIPNIVKSGNFLFLILAQIPYINATWFLTTNYVELDLVICNVGID